MGLTGAYNLPLDDEAGTAVVVHAFRRGVTLFDTSDYYGPLTNEILLGKVSIFVFLLLIFLVSWLLGSPCHWVDLDVGKPYICSMRSLVKSVLLGDSLGGKAE